MPLYEYECSVCGHRFELIQRFADPPASKCASCGEGPVHKLLSAPAVHFKGTGWYVTDYANKKSDGSPKTDAGAPKPEGAATSDGSSKSDSAAPASTPTAGNASASAAGTGGETKSASRGEAKQAETK